MPLYLLFYININTDTPQAPVEYHSSIFACKKSIDLFTRAISMYLSEISNTLNLG